MESNSKSEPVMNEIDILKSKLEQYEHRYGPLKSPVKSLFSLPKTWNEWFPIIMIVGVLLIAYFYHRDITVCREFVAQAQQSFSLNNTLNVVSNTSYTQTLGNITSIKLS